MNRTLNYSLKYGTFWILWRLRYSRIHIYIILLDHHTPIGLHMNLRVCGFVLRFWSLSHVLNSVFTSLTNSDILLQSYLRHRSWYHLLHANQLALLQLRLSHVVGCCCTFPLNNVGSKTAKANTNTVYEYKQRLLLHLYPITTGQNPSEQLLIAFCLEAIWTSVFNPSEHQIHIWMSLNHSVLNNGWYIFLS